MSTSRIWGSGLLLTGHGCFNEYLHGKGNGADASCKYCENDIDRAKKKSRNRSWKTDKTRKYERLDGGRVKTTYKQ